MAKKILILAPFYPPNIGGAETFAEGLANYLSKENDVTVLCYQPFNGKAEKIEQRNIRLGKKNERYPHTNEIKGMLTIIRLNWLLPMGKAWKGVGLKNLISLLPKMLCKAISLQRQKRFDIVYCNGLNGAFIGAILNVLFKVRVRAILLALYGFAGAGNVISDITSMVLHRMEKIYVEGESGAQDIKPLAVDRDKIVKFQHWVDQKIFYPKASAPNKKMRVLFVGRPIPEKGIRLVRACQIKLRKEVDFEYIENVPYEDLPKHYQMADVLVVPSIYPEGFVRVVAEGASSGCAILTSDQGSLPELVEGYGILFGISDYHGLLMLLEHLNKDRAMLEKHRMLAVEHAKKYFSDKNARVFLSRG